MEYPTLRRTWQRLGWSAVALALATVPCRAQTGEPSPDPRQRLTQVQTEIARIEAELEAMSGREKGLLGELDRLTAELRLRTREFEKVSLELDEVVADVEVHDATLERLDRVQSERKDYLEFRVREVYKAGEDDWIRRFVDADEADRLWQGIQYASYLSQRDAETLGALRRDEALSESELEALRDSEAELDGLRTELDTARRRLEQARRKNTAALSRLREDRRSQESALEELQLAAGELTRMIETMDVEGGSVTSLIVRPFKGRLDWPANGPVTAGFGTLIHPQFKTEVPHPGWDIQVPAGTPIRAIFDGQVVFADWMRGYGLTTIVDHGEDVLSIYAHGSVLLARRGDRVGRGQVLGHVGETGSLRGPYLYFEIRDGGKPVDPGEWLRSAP